MNQLKTREEYKRIKNTIVIFILNFNQYKRNSYHSIGRLRFDRTKQEAYVDLGHNPEEEIVSPNMQVHIIELPKFIKKKPDMEKRIDQWLYLLSGEKEEVNMAAEKNEKVKKAVETLERISLDPVEREIYESIQMREYLTKVSEQNFYEEGEKHGKELGRQEGEKVRTGKR